MDVALLLSKRKGEMRSWESIHNRGVVRRHGILELEWPVLDRLNLRTHRIPNTMISAVEKPVVLFKIKIAKHYLKLPEGFVFHLLSLFDCQDCLDVGFLSPFFP